MSNVLLNFFSIDATFHFNYIGRYINDSKYYPNASMKKVVMNNTPFLCLFALKDIEPNEEILYFYGVDNLIWHTEVHFLNPNCEIIKFNKYIKLFINL
jgi:hypothetical protein